MSGFAENLFSLYILKYGVTKTKNEDLTSLLENKKTELEKSLVN
jgi:hypothetical protein